MNETNHREQAEFHWREAAKSERDYSLLVERDLILLRTALDKIAFETDGVVEMRLIARETLHELYYGNHEQPRD